MALHNVLYSGEPNTIYVNLKPLEITHEHNTRFSIQVIICYYIEKPMFKKKSFLVRAFRSRAIDIWNNLDCAIQ